LKAKSTDRAARRLPFFNLRDPQTNVFATTPTGRDAAQLSLPDHVHPTASKGARSLTKGQNMRQLLLATVATAALTFPAVAADQLKQSDNSGLQQSSAASQSATNQQVAVDIQHKNLTSAEIKDIQQALIDKGFDPGAVDGMWGNLTRAAVWNFQQENGIDPSGEVDRQTLSALDVQLASPEQGTIGSGASAADSGSATTGAATTGSGSGSGMNNAEPAGDQSKK
jgi:hypothetical protein